MTIASRMRIETSQDGRQHLVGSLLHPLDRGALIHLRKAADGSYSLLALSGDGRRGDNSRETLGSFVLPELLGETPCQ